MAKHLSFEDLEQAVTKTSEPADYANAIDSLRTNVRWKISGLSTAQIHECPFGDALSIAGVVSHLAYLEDYWFSVVLHGNQPSKPWDNIDWKNNPNFEWEFALKKSASFLINLWEESAQRSQILWGEALAEGATLDFQVSWDDGGADVTIRWVMQRFMQEYGRSYANIKFLLDNIEGAEETLPLPF